MAKIAGLLFDSWPHDCKDFVSYLCDVWISSSERFWYEAAHPFGSTNNGLEAHNRLIKAAHTLRNLLPMPQFLKNAVEVVNGWSMRSVDPASGPEAKPYVFKEAYELSKSGRIWQKIDGQDTYVFASEGAHIGNKEDLAAAYAEFMNIELNNFDDFKKTRFKVHVVRMAATGDHFKCSCPIGAKKNACKHAIMVSCLKPVALLTYPPDAVSVMLMKKKKPGRPSQKPVGRPRLAEKQNRHATAN
ncbi:hypothetical protein AAVH_24520 [Aphelenchoides avenae]|nr:hypothetical protein AAVH_24520 [Aphelenchus avenae]